MFQTRHGEIITIPINVEIDARRNIETGEYYLYHLPSQAKSLETWTNYQEALKAYEAFNFAWDERRG